VPRGSQLNTPTRGGLHDVARGEKGKERHLLASGKKLKGSWEPNLELGIPGDLSPEKRTRSASVAGGPVLRERITLLYVEKEEGGRREIGLGTPSE